jgi:hypothetical protein
MSYRTNSDNIYKVGTIIRAKTAPGQKLTIVKYYQRTYYCDAVGEPALKQLAYFERELIPPAAADQKK